MMSNRMGYSPRSGQRGVATLIVVLVLFFVVSMVAAYTNRNLIFEQRTASNELRSVQAMETAEAGLEWAMSTLNLGRVTDTCVPSTSASDLPFRQRYLNTDSKGRITPRGPVDASNGAGLSSAACVLNATRTGWDCSCPAITATAAGTGAVSAPTAAGQWPAFSVRFLRVGGSDNPVVAPPATPQQSGVIKVQVVACTRAGVTSTDPCLNFSGQGDMGEGRAVVSSLLTLTGGASSPPQAALTARDTIAVLMSGGGFSAINAIAGGSGVTVHSGGTISGYSQLVSQPGSPGSASLIESDLEFLLPAVTVTVAGVPVTKTQRDRMFAAVFNMWPLTFEQQQAATAFPSGSLTVSQLAERNPWRPIWVSGDLAVAADIGTAANPVLMVVNGKLTFTNAAAKVYGLVYIRLPDGSDTRYPAGPDFWDTSGAGQIVGAAVSDNKIEGNGTTSYIYDPAVMNLLRWNTGSFVRVPGSWKDFQ